jgi:hypothetical protein
VVVYHGRIKIINLEIFEIVKKEDRMKRRRNNKKKE